MIAGFLTAARQSSFFLPMQLMSAAQRRAMGQLYRFCRLIDDIADGVQSIEEKQAQLNAIEQELERIYQGEPTQKQMTWLSELIDTYALEQHYFVEMIEGMHMDVHGQMLRPTLEQLECYCYRVAGCVGLLSLPIMGHNTPQAKEFAVALGHALQWTNILRDVKTDAEIGRIYLPQEWLDEAGLAKIEPRELLCDMGSLNHVLLRGYEKAQHFYKQADDLLDNARALRSAVMMRETYAQLLQQIKRDGFRYEKPYRLSLMQKIKGCWRGMITLDAPVQ